MPAENGETLTEAVTKEVRNYTHPIIHVFLAVIRYLSFCHTQNENENEMYEFELLILVLSHLWRHGFYLTFTTAIFDI